MLHDSELYPAEDPNVKRLKFQPLDPNKLLVQIQIQLLGCKTDFTSESLRQQANADLPNKKLKVPAKAGAAGKKATNKKDSGEAAADDASSSTKLEFPNEPLWT